MGGTTSENAGAEVETGEPKPESQFVTYGRGVRTTLRSNATAYGFSISITSAYGLVGSGHGSGSAVQTVVFGVGAAVAFVLIGALFVGAFPRGSLTQTGQVATIGGGADLLAVMAAVAGAFGTSRVAGFVAWPLTGFGTVIVYMLVGGLDVILARWVATYTSFGDSQ